MSDQVLDLLVSTVKKHYQNSVEPLLLSRFGQLYPDLRSELVKHYDGVGKAVRAAGVARLEIVNPTDIKGQETVVIPEKREVIETKSIENNADLRAAETALERLPISVQLAFCVRTRPGERIALQIVRPFKFRRQFTADNEESDYIIVDDKYRHQNIHLKKASPTEKQIVWRSFQAWALENKVSPNIFTGEVDAISRVANYDNALARFLALQDPDVLPRIRMPADVVEILLGHK